MKPVLSIPELKELSSSPLNDNRISTLSLYYSNVSLNHNLDKAYFWNQMCLFSNDSYCKNFIIKYSPIDRYEKIRKYFYRTLSLQPSDDLEKLSFGENIDLQTLLNNDPTDRCLILYFSAQNKNRTGINLLKNDIKKSNSCLDTFSQWLPELKEHKEQFIVYLNQM